MKPQRIEALADGIFAIAMTLLILDIHVPLVRVLQWSTITPLLPKLLSLVISFIILAIYWSSHHMLFARLNKANFHFMWRNIWFLLFITLIPFSTALLGAYPYVQVAQIVYAGTLILCGTILYSCIYYAIRIEPLVTEAPSLEFRRNVAGKILFPPVMYLLAILVSFLNTRYSLFLLVCGPLSYFVSVDSKVWALITKPFARYIV